MSAREVDVMIVAVAVMAVALAAPAVIAVALVSMAGRREYSVGPLADRQDTRVQAGARRIVGFYAEGIDWPPPTGGSRRPRQCTGSRG